MRGDLIVGERNVFDPGHLSDNERSADTCPLVHRHPAAEVREGECLLPVAAISSADQVEEDVIIGDGQQLSLAKQPADGRKIARELHDLPNKIDAGLELNAVPSNFVVTWLRSLSYIYSFFPSACSSCSYGF